MNAPLLDVQDLRVTFRTRRGAVHAVDGVSLSVAPGEVLGLVGESGSGKSVTLRAIPRLLHANATIAGRVLWRGEDVLGLDAARLRALRGGQIGMVFQEPMSALNPVLPIGLQIDEVLVAHTPLDRAARRARAAELLGLVGIASAATRLDQYPHEFSGGMRQRAMIAIALAAQPALLLADEPTTALDVTIQDQILKLLLRLAGELAMALVLVTHDLGVVAQTCDRVAVMYAGRLCETGPVGAVFAQPRHAYTEALLGAMPGEGRPGAPLAVIPGQPPRIDAPIRGCAFAPRCAYTETICTKTRPPLAAIAPGRASACHAASRLKPRTAA
ncbi:MAG: ABC transporter ATP-binding protein [Rhodospirillales bacterium]|nr:ABC transporter ATP-binding protein [Rhodospirillales bacterium]MDE2573871.1 ABC transporter ATP-binding protein [Rhodospirillales bacterium]